ncbi:MAG TPA: serine hydrolase [Anaerolineae bacterium]|nr:serine hydrolase [Anaerolineae bacterium]
MSMQHSPNGSIRRLAPILLSLVLIGCSSAPATIAPTSTPRPAATPLAPTLPAPTEVHIEWPTNGWPTSTPEEQGIDGTKLAQLLDKIKEEHLNLNSLLIIRHGYLVSENYFGDYQADTRHELYSVTKSFVGTLIGIALDQGKIQGVDQHVVDFFPGRTFANLDARKQSMTLEDLLTMQSGLDWQEGDPTYIAIYRSPDWAQYVLDEPMAEAPGSVFNYCSGCSHVLSVILQQATGQDTRAYADHYLFQPLGISHVVWDVDSTAIAIGGWGLQITPRDMAKLGYLYLHDGLWDGRQIVSAQWVKNATRTHVATGSTLDYGYQWWIAPSAYAALGRYGQMIYVVPESDLIVVMTAELANHDPEFQLIQQYILPAVKGQ